MPVGNPGNMADTEVMTDGTAGYGSVGYVYSIGKYDVTAGQYAAFLNAVGRAPNSNMKTTPAGSQIKWDFHTLAYTATLPNQPMNNVSWGDAARFCNWLQIGQPMDPASVPGKY